MKSYILTESQYKRLVEGLEFNKVYNETYDTVFKYVCMKFAKGDVDLANDYCQNGYIAVNKNLDKYSGIGSITGWVRKVVTNSIINELRKTRLDYENDPNIENIKIADDSDKELELMGGQVTPEIIKKAIKSLPEGYKIVVLLYYFADKDHTEIANELGIDPGTSRSQLFKAKKILKNYLSKYVK